MDLAKKLKRRQDYVSDIETGQEVVTVVELMEWAAALGFDPHDVLRVLKGSRAAPSIETRCGGRQMLRYASGFS